MAGKQEATRLLAVWDILQSWDMVGKLVQVVEFFLQIESDSTKLDMKGTESCYHE